MIRTSRRRITRSISESLLSSRHFPVLVIQTFLKTRGIEQSSRIREFEHQVRRRLYDFLIAFHLHLVETEDVLPSVGRQVARGMMKAVPSSSVKNGYIITRISPCRPLYHISPYLKMILMPLGFGFQRKTHCLWKCGPAARRPRQFCRAGRLGTECRTLCAKTNGKAR